MTGPKRVTDKQLAANRANAQRSTGPRTPEGKAIARYNALTHGILARAVIPEALTPYESLDDFDALLAALTHALAPTDAIQELLVQQVAVAYWRLARLYRAEAGAIAHRRGSAERDLAQAQAQARLWARGFPHLVPDAADRLRTEQEALETAMGDPRTLRAYLVARDPELDAVESDRLESLAQDLLAQIRQQRAALLQQRRATENASRSLPPVDVATKYARYETALQNQLDRALSRLERLQRARTGDYVAPPLHIDVTGIEAPHADP